MAFRQEEKIIKFSGKGWTVSEASKNNWLNQIAQTAQKQGKYRTAAWACFKSRRRVNAKQGWLLMLKRNRLRDWHFRNCRAWNCHRLQDKGQRYWRANQSSMPGRKFIICLLMLLLLANGTCILKLCFWSYLEVLLTLKAATLNTPCNPVSFKSKVNLIDKLVSKVKLI